MSMINKFPRVSRIKLLPEVFPPGSLRSRLPEHFKARYLAKLEKKPDVSHQVPYEAKYRIDNETGFRLPIQDPPIRTKRPPTFDRVLFGGERVIEGWEKPEPNLVNGPYTIVDGANDKKLPQFWFPKYRVQTFFSDILDKYYTVPVTDTTMDAIDAAAGFDRYILETDVVNLDSRLGEFLQKEMLRKLSRDEAGPADDPPKRREIYEEYKRYLIPDEEIEWLALTVAEACAKQMEIEAQTVERRTVPLKYIFAKKVYDEMKLTSHMEEEEVEESGFIGRFKPRK